GWTVTALVRNPQKLTVTHERLTVITGELSDEDAVRRSLTQVEAAVIALGTGTDLQATHSLSDGTAQIVKALQAAGIQRTVCLLSGWLFYIQIPPQFVEITHDHARQLAVLQASTLEWVAVCPPALIDRPARQTYQVTLDRLPGAGYQEIGVDDLADFMLRAVVEPAYIRQKVGIAD
ncbi:MAG: NAD(P)H-binding protein, partial [Armatimonadetes bacterium]|nr:NAD(P)H-binding protein [Anaerolineae bacterium]